MPGLKELSYVSTIMFLISLPSISQNVGIGTTTPLSSFHVARGSILFNSDTGSTPIGGAGTRLMWIPGRSALRAGYVDNNQWDAGNIGSFSVALGYGTRATDIVSTAFGASTLASATYSTAMGHSTTASALSSTAMGELTTAAGNYSTAIGYTSGAYALYSTAIGDSCTTYGAASVAMG